MRAMLAVLTDVKTALYQADLLPLVCILLSVTICIISFIFSINLLLNAFLRRN